MKVSDAEKKPRRRRRYAFGSPFFHLSVQVSSLPSLSYLRSLKAVDAQSVAQGGLSFKSPARARSCLRSRRMHRVGFDVAAIGNDTSESRRQPAGDAVAEGLDVIGGHHGLFLSISPFEVVGVRPARWRRGTRSSSKSVSFDAFSMGDVTICSTPFSSLSIKGRLSVLPLSTLSD